MRCPGSAKQEQAALPDGNRAYSYFTEPLLFTVLTRHSEENACRIAAASLPSTSITFAGDPWPLTKAILDGSNPRRSASRATTASVARPFWRVAFTFTVGELPSQPTICPALRRFFIREPFPAPAGSRGFSHKDWLRIWGGGHSALARTEVGAKVTGRDAFAAP